MRFHLRIDSDCEKETVNPKKTSSELKDWMQDSDWKLQN